jgi:hypothetical protein
MDVFIAEIVADIDWRVAQMATLKTIPIIYSFSKEHKEQHVKFAIPAVYAIWEGYVKASLGRYISHLKTLKIKREHLSLNILTHTIDETCKLNNARVNFDTKSKMVQSLDTLFSDIIDISSNIPTGSNVNYDVISSLLNRFCIREIDKDKYEKPLNKLLRFRNHIAHGDNALKVEERNLTEFVTLPRLHTKNHDGTVTVPSWYTNCTIMP